MASMDATQEQPESEVRGGACVNYRLLCWAFPKQVVLSHALPVHFSCILGRRSGCWQGPQGTGSPEAA